MKYHSERTAWVKFYPDDFLGGVAMLPIAARGAFWTLCSLQAAGQKIANNFDQICCACPGLDHATWLMIREKFEVVEDDDGNQWLENPRMAKERAKAQDGAEKNRTNVAKSRARKAGVSITKPPQNQNQNQTQTHEPEPIPPQTPQGGQEGGGDSSNAHSGPQILSEWLQHWNGPRGRYEIGKPTQAKLGLLVGDLPPDAVLTMCEALEEERIGLINRGERWKNAGARIRAEIEVFKKAVH